MGWKVKIISYLVLVLTLGISQLHAAEETEESKLLAVQKIELNGRPMLMVGMGLTQLMNDDYYIGAFYIDEAAQFTDADDLAYIDAPRRMEFRFASNRTVSASGFARKVLEGIKINNANANIKEESEALGRFRKFFRGSFKKGDIVCFDYYSNSARVVVKKNGRSIGEIDRAKDLYQLLVKVWVGERPPSSRFRDGISGKNENEYAIELLKRYVNL